MSVGDDIRLTSCHFEHRTKLIVSCVDIEEPSLTPFFSSSFLNHGVSDFFIGVVRNSKTILALSQI